MSIYVQVQMTAVTWLYRIAGYFQVRKFRTTSLDLNFVRDGEFEN